MAIITNRSPHALGIIGPIAKVKDGEPLLPPAFQTIVPAVDLKDRKPVLATIPDDVAKFWAEKDPGKALINQNLVEIKMDGLTKPKPSADPKDAVHWRTAVANVKDMDSLDALEALHATESRPRVIEAIETRMGELNG